MKNGKDMIVKEFVQTTPESIMDYMVRHPTKRVWYENTQPLSPLCFMLDVDYTYEKDGDLDFAACKESLDTDIIPSVHTAWVSMGLPKPSASVPEPLVFNSCRTNKFSYHIHFPAYLFSDRNLHAYFAHQVWKALKNVNAKLYPDPAIYGSGQRQFRLAYCFKLGKPESAKVPVGGKPLFEDVTVE
jgi:hypothetical protein